MWKKRWGKKASNKLGMNKVVTEEQSSQSRIVPAQVAVETELLCKCATHAASKRFRS
jgi:hypothetical protein